MSRAGAGLPSIALAKASLVPVGSFFLGGLKFKYNPEQFTLTKSSEWKNLGFSREEGWPEPTYLATNPGNLSLEIFLDAFEQIAGDVSGDVRTLVDWTKPGPPNDEPPLLEFHWGLNNVMPGMQFYLESVTATYTLFRSDGTPIRATCNLELVEFSNPASRQNPTSGGKPGVQAHTLIEGETLHTVAWAQYGNPGYWRSIAEFNGIDDPTRVPSGTRLLIPPRRDAATLA